MMNPWAALPPQATPDVIGGFIFGMTGDSDHHPISECYKAPTPDLLDIELQTAVSELRKDTLTADIASGTAFALFIEQFPSTLASCQGLGDDLKEI